MNLYISFLWHFHQPFYFDLKKEMFYLPWVRLHSLRNYYALGKYTELPPKVKMNFNFTPSLIESIEGYNSGRYDYLFILEQKRISELKDEEKLYIIKNSFYGYYPTTIKPFERYRELYVKKIENELSEEMLLKKFTESDLIDLIVLSNLSWFSQYDRERDGFLIYLTKKGRGFSEHEKQSLLEKELQVIKRVIPLYRALQNKGQIEITTTPYAHPIVPLIADNYSARISLPHHPLPEKRFSYPQDAELHIRKAISVYYKAFGVFPQGMWPSEGAVGSFILPLFWRNGIKWVATDSEILGMTKDIFLAYDGEGVTESPELLYRPYMLKSGIPKFYVVFRDHALSDLFGFVYSGMSGEDAMKDFVYKLEKIRRKLEGRDGDYLITIILDGENPWEYYEKGKGDKFFNTLLETLEELSFVKSIRISDFIKKEDSFELLPYIYTGSWIDHNLRTWIGDKGKNLAWEYLYKVRTEFDKWEYDTIQDKENVLKSLLYAEGSDWFWWYGEGHESPEEDKLDYLFRTHLKNVYSLTGRTPPSFLDKPIVTIIPRHIPQKKISPLVDGKEDVGEWDGAGIYEVKGGAMSNANISLPFHRIFYGNDDVNFYIRLDLEKDCCDNIEVIINEKRYKYDLRNIKGDTPFAYGDVVEISLPIERNEEKVRLRLVFEKGNTKVSFPLDYYMIIPLK